MTGQDFEKLGEDVTKDNYIETYREYLGKKFNVSVQNFRHIDHYFSPSFIAELNERIEKANVALGAEHLEALAGRKIPSELLRDIPRGENIGKELSGIVEAIVGAVNDELRVAIESLERLSGLRR